LNGFELLDSRWLLAKVRSGEFTVIFCDLEAGHLAQKVNSFRFSLLLSVEQRFRSETTFNYVAGWADRDN
jgi:hypothetical protein